MVRNCANDGYPSMESHVDHLHCVSKNALWKPNLVHLLPQVHKDVGALLIMLFYIWLNANLLLLGFELDQSLRRLKERTMPEVQSS